MMNELSSVLEYSGNVEDTQPGVDEMPSVSFVWDVFKESDTCAKLILPDILTNPFYLSSPRATKADKDAKFERELRRIDFVCERDSKNCRPSARRNILNSIPDYSLHGKDRAIERRLVDPYRNDTLKRRELMRQVIEREENNPTPVKKKTLINHKAPAAKPSADLREQRHTLVLQRHTLLLDAKKDSIVAFAEKQEEKRLKVQEILMQHQMQLAKSRISRWIQIIATIKSLKCMFSLVTNVRRTKALSPERWKACSKIQKWFRKIVFFKLKKNIRGCRPVRKVNTVLQMLREAALKAGGERSLYSIRQKACTVITTFLRELQGRMTVYVRKFISKIKNLQYYIRRHTKINAARIGMLQRFVEFCLPVMLIQMEVVTQGRGHDLKNLTSYDINKISTVDRFSARFRIVHSMNTASYHAYLRSNITQLSTVLSVFKPHGGRVSRNMEHGWDEMFELLQRKRRIHQIDLERAKIIKLNIPEFDTTQIKTFIDGGDDPLRNFLIGAQIEEDSRNEAYQAARLVKGGLQKLGGNKLLLLLRNIDLEDISLLVMSVAAKLSDHRKNKFNITPTTPNLQSPKPHTPTQQSGGFISSLGSQSGDQSDSSDEFNAIRRHITSGNGNRCTPINSTNAARLSGTSPAVTTGSSSAVTSVHASLGGSITSAKFSTTGIAERVISGQQRAFNNKNNMERMRDSSMKVDIKSPDKANRGTSRDRVQIESISSGAAACSLKEDDSTATALRPATPPKKTSFSKVESPQKGRRTSAAKAPVF